MLEWITFGLLVAKIVLDFVAPKTKTKADDKARDIVHKAEEVLPLVAPLLPSASAPKSTDPTATASGGVVVRDHR